MSGYSARIVMRDPGRWRTFQRPGCRRDHRRPGSVGDL